jgi:hypothetical protein
MNIVKTKNITIKGIYENDTTFSRLLVEKICEELSAYGFSYEVDSSNRNYILWNGKRRWQISAVSNASQISMRVAAAYGNSSWGSTYSFGSISSTSTSEQSFTYELAFFGFDDFCYLRINKSIPLYSMPIVDLDEKKSVLNTKDYFSVIAPLSATSMDNDTPWSISYLSYYNIKVEDPAKCFISDTFTLMHLGILKYVMPGMYSIATSASTFSTGQVITVDGEKYINLFDKVFAKISADELETVLNKVG